MQLFMIHYDGDALYVVARTMMHAIERWREWLTKDKDLNMSAEEAALVDPDSVAHVAPAHEVIA